MQVFRCLVVLALGLMFAGARQVEERQIEPRTWTHIAPGSYETFQSDRFFTSRGESRVGEYKTDDTATLIVSCSAILPCASSAFVVAIGSSKQLLGYHCSYGSQLWTFDDMTAGNAVTLFAYSGSDIGSQFDCQIRSVKLKVTTTRPTSTTTRPTTTTTRPTTTTTRPISTTTQPIKTTTKPVVTNGTSVCQCGTTGGPKIVGGTNVAEGEIPWQVGLGYGVAGAFNTFCGGTLIGPNYVVSAAHCLEISDLDVLVIMGTINRMSPTATLVGIDTITPHEKYDSMNDDNDILVLKLKSSVTYTSNVFPACLPRRLTSETFDGKDLVVSGWGRTTPGTPSSPNLLMKATVVGIRNAKCNEQYGAGRMTDGMLCAESPGKDSCQGDSGGPLTYTESGVTYLVGVVSFGIGCANPNYPGVYARVTKYLSWIDSKTATPLCSK